MTTYGNAGCGHISGEISEALRAAYDCLGCITDHLENGTATCAGIDVDCLAANLAIIETGLMLQRLGVTQVERL